MNAYDWLMNLPLSDLDTGCKVVEVSFNRGSRKDFFRNTTIQQFEKGDLIAVEGISGFDVGEISLTGEVVRIQMKKRNVSEFDSDLKKVLRRATDKDLEIWQQNKAREKEALIQTRAITKQLNLEMKMSEVEIQADGRKATFFYIADDRVDFRELIKILAREFKVKVEMRQIGARQEAAKVGGWEAADANCAAVPGSPILNRSTPPPPVTRTCPSTKASSAVSAAVSNAASTTNSIPTSMLCRRSPTMPICCR